MITKGRFYLTLFIISLVLLLSWTGIRISKAITFQEEVEGYLENYVEAGTVETATENLDSAIESLEKAGLTKGQISIFCKNPNNNIGLWYNNLLKSREALKKASKETPFEQSIILEKQRNGLTDDGTFEVPMGISIYPYNKLFFWWSILSVIGMIAFGIIVLTLSDSYEWDQPLIKLKDKKAEAY